MKCIKTGIDMIECPHCLGEDYIVLDAPPIEYETIGGAFRSHFRGVCAVEPRHDVRKGDLVSRVQRIDNPNVTISGVACRTCTLMLPTGKS